MNTRCGSVASFTARSNSRPGERHGDAVEAHLARTPIDHELADLEHLGRPGTGPSQHGADTGEQLRVHLALGDVVRPALEGAHALDRVGVRRREHDHRHVAVPAPPGLTLTEPRAQLGLAREHDVGPRALGDVERLRAPARLDDVEAVRAQVPAQIARLVRVGVGEEERCSHGTPRLEPAPRRHQLSFAADL